MSDRAKGILFLVGVYLAMLAGMGAKFFFDHLSHGTDPNYRQLVPPLLVSPMVYGVIFKAVQGSNETVLMLIFGFQNGFFWQDIFGQIGRGS